jgi:hypothetical protein
MFFFRCVFPLVLSGSSCRSFFMFGSFLVCLLTCLLFFLSSFFRGSYASLLT